MTYNLHLQLEVDNDFIKEFESNGEVYIDNLTDKLYDIIMNNTYEIERLSISNLD